MLLYRISKWSIKTQETKLIYGGGGNMGRDNQKMKKLLKTTVKWKNFVIKYAYIFTALSLYIIVVAQSVL
jgi:hypothetical protein